MPGIPTTDTLFPYPNERNLAESCGSAGYYAMALENAVIMQEDLRETYAQNLTRCVFNNRNEALHKAIGHIKADSFSPDVRAALYIHLPLSGDRDRGGLAENARLRLEAAALTLETADSKQDILRSLDLNAQDLTRLQHATPKPPSLLQKLQDWVAMTGVLGATEQQDARYNLAGMQAVIDNAKAHRVAYFEPDACDLTPAHINVAVPMRARYITTLGR